MIKKYTYNFYIDEDEIIRLLERFNQIMQDLDGIYESASNHPEKTDIRQSEPLSKQGENPCVKVTNEINKEALKDYASSVLNESGEKHGN
jgi:type II secretory ATPase GspE/PulE/Tfp pilus assembly ATPase PilB-like protein